MNHLKILNTLSKVAEAVEPPCNGYKLASAIVYNGDILAIGTNSRKTHPMQAKYGDYTVKAEFSIFLHAEMDCIIRAKKHRFNCDLSKASLYVVRIKYVHKLASQITGIRGWGLSRPCAACSKAIKEIGITTVIYSEEGGSFTISKTNK